MNHEVFLSPKYDCVTVEEFIESQEGDTARTRATLTQTQLNLYARLGLRTLCMAKRVRGLRCGIM